MSPPAPKEESVNLDAMKKRELQALAKKLGLKGYSRLNNPELIALIMDNADDSEIRKHVEPTLWNRFVRRPSHPYGVAGLVIGVISGVAAVLFYVSGNEATSNVEEAVRKTAEKTNRKIPCEDAFLSKNCLTTPLLVACYRYSTIYGRAHLNEARSVGS